MDTVTKSVSFEEVIKGSRFLSELFPCQSQSDARNFLKEQKQRYADATHVVHAFITGPNAEIMGMSDDGEPSGTAGRPVLDVLRGRGCTNAMLTITRWFGGTLLGTGGLVKAYSNGAKRVIEAADAQAAFSPLVSRTEFSFFTDYTLYTPIKQLMKELSATDLSEEFGTDIKIQGKIISEDFPVLKSRLSDLSKGKILL